ncbi:hypothetical protein KTI59_15855, partial [Acinetobacter radioresistens]|uniref:hypothetical protein n=1 Tax=Acinetobacter radioresistens TaxID=40216 RepID=UPI0021CDD56A
LAEANAKVAEIPLNRLVRVLSATDGGDYYKASADATSLTKSAFDPVEQAKADATTKANAAESNAKAYFRNNGFARLVLAASGAINYNTETRELTFSGTIHIVTNSGTQALNTPQVLKLTNTSPYRIEYDQSANTLHSVPYGSAKVDGRIVLGSATGLASGIETEGFVSTTNGRVTYQSEIGEVFASPATRINFDNTAGKLSIHPLVRIKSPTYSSTVGGDTNTEVNYPSSNGTYKLRFNTADRTFQFSLTSVVVPMSNIELATVVFSGGVATSVEGLRVYTIDGSAPTASTSATSPTATLAASDASNINFDFENKKLIMPSGKVRLNYDKISLLITTDLEINFAETPADNYWHKFIYNKETKVFSAKQFSSSLADNELVFALIQPRTKSVFGVPDYYINGKPSKTLFPAADFLYTLCDAKPRYE